MCVVNGARGVTARGALLLAVLVVSLGAERASGANLEGRVLDGSTPDGSVPELDVRLTAQLADQSRIDRTIQTDANGNFAFTELPGDTADVYVLSTNFDGVDYVSSFIRFPLGADLVETDLLVYHSTDDPSLLRLNARHLVIEIAPGVDHVLVTEVLAFGNPGQQTIVPESPITLSAPPHAFELTAVEGFEDARILGDQLALSLDGSIRPGTFRYEGAIRYHLPARFPLHMHITETLPTDEVTALVAPTGTQVNGEGLEPLGVIDLGGGVICDRYRLPVEPGSGDYHFEIASVAPRVASGSPRVWLITGGILAAFLGLLLLREREPGAGDASGELDRLEADRDRYLREIVALDGDASRAQEREKLLVKATAIQELMDELAERRS